MQTRALPASLLFCGSFGLDEDKTVAALGIAKELGHTGTFDVLAKDRNVRVSHKVQGLHPGLPCHIAVVVPHDGHFRMFGLDVEAVDDVAPDVALFSLPVQLEHGMASCVAWHADWGEPGDNLFAFPEALHLIAVDAQKLFRLIKAEALGLRDRGGVVPVFPESQFSVVHVDLGVFEGLFAVPGEAAKVIAVHVGQENQFHVVRVVAGLEEILVHGAGLDVPEAGIDEVQALVRLDDVGRDGVRAHAGGDKFVYDVPVSVHEVHRNAISAVDNAHDLHGADSVDGDVCGQGRGRKGEGQQGRAKDVFHGSIPR